MEESSGNGAALVVATYAAVVATVGALWQLRTWWNDRPRVEVEIRFGLTTHTTGLLMVLRAINHGRQPAQLIGAGFGLKDGRNLINISTNPPGIPQNNFPHDLKPGTRYEAHFMLESVVDALARDNHGQPPQTAWFDDATGKQYVKKMNRKLFENWSRRLG